jgi:diacylglycerol kinase family enzyme
MDICYLNDHLFLGTAGIGFDARVADRFDRSGTRGMFTYALIIVQEIFGAPPMPVELQVDGKTIKENVLMLVFCNTREFGNGADISPSSKPDDGFAELRLVRKPPCLLRHLHPPGGRQPLPHQHTGHAGHGKAGRHHGTLGWRTAGSGARSALPVGSG